MTKEKELYGEILHHEILYRNGEPAISDFEFDQLVDKLRELNPNHEYFHSQYTIKSDGQKEKLPFNMRSLDKVKSISDLKKWFKKCGLKESDKVVIAPKYDGLSILLDTSTGSAWTRGGENNEGFRKDKHLKDANNAFNKMLNSLIRYVGGEILITNGCWDLYFKGKTNPRSGEPYKTQRGTVAGLINSPESSILMNCCSFIPYVAPDLEYEGNYSKLLNALSKFNNVIPEYQQYDLCEVGDITEEFLNGWYCAWSKYCEVDGVVITIDCNIKQKELGRDPKTLNPRYQIAYKGNFEVPHSTTVKDVNCRVSKNGYLRPTVEIEPVIIDGCQIENPTGNNMAFIIDNHLAPGTEIKVIRSGSVIPKIVHFGKYVEGATEDLLDRFAECPSCGSPTCWNNTMTDLVCTNDGCCGRRLAKIVHFFNIMGFEEFGDKTIETLFNAGVDYLDKFIHITFEQLVAIDGIGDSTANNIVSQMKKLKESEHKMEKLMHASDVFDGVGESKAKLIVDYVHSQGITIFDLRLGHADFIQGIGESAMVAVMNGREFFINWCSELGLKISEVKDDSVIDNSFGGESICFSGVRDKSLEDEFKNRGARIVSSVSAKTTMLIVKDADESTSKIEKAKSLGVKIVSIDDARKLIV